VNLGRLRSPNHLVIEGPSSDGSRVAASLDDVNSPSSSVRSVPKDEETHASPRQWAPVFSVPGALCMASWSRLDGWSLFLIWDAFSDYDCQIKIKRYSDAQYFMLFETLNDVCGRE
jgi:hypothetical protein